MSLSPDKCCFGFHKVPLLGHVVSVNGIQKGGMNIGNETSSWYLKSTKFLEQNQLPQLFYIQPSRSGQTNYSLVIESH